MGLDSEFGKMEEGGAGGGLDCWASGHLSLFFGVVLVVVGRRGGG